MSSGRAGNHLGLCEMKEERLDDDRPEKNSGETEEVTGIGKSLLTPHLTSGTFLSPYLKHPARLHPGTQICRS
jgi:hypothetical protein